MTKQPSQKAQDQIRLLGFKDSLPTEYAMLMGRLFPKYKSERKKILIRNVVNLRTYDKNVIDDLEKMMSTLKPI